MSQDSALRKELEAAIAGLQWMSESDYPFEVCEWSEQNADDLRPEQLSALTHHPANTPIETQDFDNFFEVATQAQDWHGPEERATVQRYQALVKILKQYLSNLKVYRLGRINVDIYILGKTAEGTVAGVATKAVET